MESNVKYRHEFKYQCSIAELTLIKHRIAHILPLDRHAAPKGEYCIRSMYFDSLDHRCFYENENGTDCREKFRIRIYNANKHRISLECKRKEHGKTHKTACLLSEETFDRIMDRSLLPDPASAPPVLQRFFYLMRTEHFSPSVIVEYDRIPYVHPLGNVRVTLDTNIRSSNAFEDFFLPSLPVRPILPTGQHLLEVKYDEFIPDYVKTLLQLENLQQATFSKFYLCKKYSMRGIL